MGLVNDGQRWEEGPTGFYVEWRHVIMGRRRLGDQAGTTGEHSESEAKSTLSGDFMEPLKMERVWAATSQKESKTSPALGYEN